MFFAKKKRKGYIVIQTVLALIATTMLSYSIFTITSGQFSMIQASRVGLQAQQYAQIDANTLQLLSYDELDSNGAHSRQTLTSVADATGWQDEITIGEEQTIGTDTDNKQRIATIKIYKEGDTLARYSSQVPLSSKGSSSVPKGTILAYYGNLSDIPLGWIYCDGTKGSPDLRGRALVGAGAWNDSYGSITYSLGDTGGERKHQLSIAELPTHNFSFTIQIPLFGNNDSQGIYPVGGDFWGTNFGSYNVNGITNTIGGNQPHNIMQPYYVLYYIMKV